MNENIKRAGGIAASAVVALASCGAVYGVATAQGAATDAYAAETAKDQTQKLPIVNVANVEGKFSFTQDALSPKEEIAGIFNKQVKAMCGARPEGAEPASIDEWEISVGGDVANAFTATVGDLAQEETKQTVMTCTCSKTARPAPPPTPTSSTWCNDLRHVAAATCGRHSRVAPPRKGGPCSGPPFFTSRSGCGERSRPA